MGFFSNEVRRTGSYRHLLPVHSDLYFMSNVSTTLRSWLLTAGPAGLEITSRLLDRLDQPRQSFLSIAIQHARHVFEEQRILQTRKTFSLSALQHHD